MEWLVFALSVVVAGITFWQASEARAARKDARLARDDSQTARSESQAARDEARELTREANAAFVRQAIAQEEANALAKAAIPKKVPKISVQQISDSRWMATNTGDAVAESAQVTGTSGIVDVDDAEPRTLHPGDSLFFYSIKTFGSGQNRIAIEYTYADEDGESHEIRNEITLP